MSERLYIEIVNAANDCLGASAERLISRLINIRLNKPPHDIEIEDIPELLDWAKLIIGLYTDKQQVISRFTDQMELLQSKSREDI